MKKDDRPATVTESEAYDDLPEGDGVLVLDPRGQVMAANLQVERLLRSRFSRGRLVRMEDLFSIEYLPQAELAFREALQGGHSRCDLTADLRRPVGPPAPVIYSVTPLHDGGDRIIGVVLGFRDALPPISAAGPLYRPGLAFDTLFENLAEGVFTINTHWRVTAFNRRAQEITGYDKDEVLGRFCWDIFKSDLCRSACPLKVTLETGVTHMDQDVRIVGRFGRMSILVNTSVLKDRRDRVIGAVETFRPVSAGSSLGVLESRGGAPLIVGQCPAVLKLLDQVPDVAAAGASVVIEGESGTGKELFARAIHNESPRAEGPFVAVNCSALAETLLESELFGHEKGAFTGAVNSRAGRFELARGGTLFLDEISEIKPEIQVKLLRILQEKVFERVGGTRPITMDARVIAATNRNLAKEVKAGRFREDLFYRLRTVPLRLPPLRERHEDIPLLVNHFVAKLNAVYRKEVRGVDPKVMTFFQRYAWPGNVREMEHVLEYAFVFVKGPVITMAHLPDMSDQPPKNPSMSPALTPPEPWADEKRTILKALEKARGRRQEAAQALGISRSSLWRKMKIHGLT
ncbi:MAG: sigma 54-interacting transcriptional regulator [Thermodesulfobacteriota bacterium]